jgi:hypothetical protein
MLTNNNKNNLHSMLLVCLLSAISILVGVYDDIGVGVDAAFMQPVQEVVLESCKDYGIRSGDTMDGDCAAYCAPNSTDTYDYADTDEDPLYVIRNTVCRCYSTEAQIDLNEGTEDVEGSGTSNTNQASNSMTFECWTKAEVWEKAIPILQCGKKYNITSVTTCQEFCKTIDPSAYSFAGNAGAAQCICSGVEVCNDMTASG